MDSFSPGHVVTPFSDSYLPTTTDGGCPALSYRSIPDEFEKRLSSLLKKTVVKNPFHLYTPRKYLLVIAFRGFTPKKSLQKRPVEEGKHGKTS
jgi:hypothetical protein